MKGHSKIELTDVSGNVEVYEDDNMITNALNDIICNKSACAANPIELFYDVPLWTKLVGGLLLFGETIEENVEKYGVDWSLSTIGNGAYDYGAISDVTELGSWNEQESGMQEDGSLKLVYDFSTAQANGTIKCACLTSDNFGGVGTGNISSNKSKVFNTRGISDYFNKGSGNVITKEVSASNKDTILFVDYKNNTMYVLDYNTLYYSASYADVHFTSTGYIVVKKCLFSMSKCSLRNDVNTMQVIEEISVEVPKSFIDWSTSINKVNYFSIKRNENNLYILSSKTNGSFLKGQVAHVLKIDSSLKASDYVVTNNSSGSLYVMNYFIGVDNDEYAYFVTGSSTCDIFKINIKDSTDIAQIDLNGNSFYGSYSSKTSFRRNAFICSNMKIDCKKNKILPINNYYTTTNGWFEGYNRVNALGDELLFVGVTSTNSGEYPKVGMYSDYLATINNLATPVVKTSDKSMKVTYTLTFDE